VAEFIDELEDAAGLLRSGAVLEAREALLALDKKHPEQAQLHQLLGSAFARLQDTTLAISHYKLALDLYVTRDIDGTPVRIQLAEVLTEIGEFHQAKRQLSIASKTQAMDPQLQLQMAELDIAQFDTDSAGHRLQRALAISPDNPRILLQLGNLARIRGDAETAARYFKQVISSQSHAAEAYYGLVSVQPDDINLQELQHAFERADTRDKIALGYSLGRLLDRRGEYDHGFDYTLAANQLQLKILGYSERGQAEFFYRHQQHLGPALMKRCRSEGLQTNKPIFILGMPRSGTSLVEQVLASHSTVFGGGEVVFSSVFERACRAHTAKAFPEDIDRVPMATLFDATTRYIERLASLSPDSDRIVDKLPHNFLRIGLLAALMPNASIIHCERDPRDTCLSIFQHRFNDAHGYSTDLIALGRYYNRYSELMAYWNQLLPGRIHNVSYESLVENPAPTIANLIEYCQLDLEDACLLPHLTDRTVNTPSAEQVRQPFFTGSVGRWRNYETQLRPLMEALGTGPH